jgi:hypothetical protein
MGLADDKLRGGFEARCMAPQARQAERVPPCECRVVLAEPRKIGVADFPNSGTIEDRQMPARFADLATIDEPNVDKFLLRIDAEFFAASKPSRFATMTAASPRNWWS